MVVYLEGKVLEEVSSAVGLVGLGAAAGIDPDTDGRGLGVGRVLSGDSEAVAEGGALSLGAVGDGGSETAEARQRAILDGVDGGAAARGVLQVQCEPTRSHCRGHCWRRGIWAEMGGKGGWEWQLFAGCCCWYEDVGLASFLRNKPPPTMVSTRASLGTVENDFGCRLRIIQHGSETARQRSLPLSSASAEVTSRSSQSRLVERY